MISIGTRTLLFGVHQFIYHPLTVYRAWCWLYGRRPNWWQTVAIFCHDLGYVGKPNLDGVEGKTHPEGGADLTYKVTLFLSRFAGFKEPHWGPFETASAALVEALHHSREYAKQTGQTPSQLCWADKACILFENPSFYLLRARLSGELSEFKQHAEPYIGKSTDENWLVWYRSIVRALLLRPEAGACGQARKELELGCL